MFSRSGGGVRESASHSHGFRPHELQVCLKFLRRTPALKHPQDPWRVTVILVWGHPTLDQVWDHAYRVPSTEGILHDFKIIACKSLDDVQAGILGVLPCLCSPGRDLRRSRLQSLWQPKQALVTDGKVFRIVFDDRKDDEIGIFGGNVDLGSKSGETRRCFEDV